MLSFQGSRSHHLPASFFVVICGNNNNVIGLQQIRFVLGALYGIFLGVRNETRGVTAALFGFNLIAFGT